MMFTIGMKIDVVLPEDLKAVGWQRITNEAFARAFGPGKDDSVIRVLDTIFTALQDPEHWKTGFAATIITTPDGFDLVEWMAAAMNWYHACQPIIYRGAEGCHGMVVTTGYAA